MKIRSRDILKKLDFVIIVVSICTIVTLFLLFMSGQDDRLQVEIQTKGARYLYPLEEDRKITVQGPIGKSYIVIKEESVSFVAPSPCRDKICLRIGELRKIGEWSACLPNQVLVRVIGKKGPDDIDALST